MKWAEFEQQLGAAFREVVAEVEGDRVLIPDTPFNLNDALLLAVEPKDCAQEDLAQFFRGLEAGEEGPRSVRADMLLSEHAGLSEVIAFEWASMGPMCWYSRIGRLDFAAGRSYACLNHEDEPLLAFAAVEGGRAGWSWLFSDVCASNGERYGVGLFGSVPGDTHNRLPDLLPETIVREAYGRWLDINDDGWWWFEQEIVPDAAHASHSSEIERTIARSTVDLEAILNAEPQRNDAFDQTRRRFLLDLYFTHCYSE
jgi:hypothetical protein